MPKPLSSVPSYPFTRFSWKGKHGSTEASDLGLPAGAEPGSRVYADSADVGFVVRGESSDKLFLHVATELDREREAKQWGFESSDGFTVTVYND